MEAFVDVFFSWHVSVNIFMHLLVMITVSIFAFMIMHIKSSSSLLDKIGNSLFWLTTTVLATKWAHHNFYNINI